MHRLGTRFISGIAIGRLLNPRVVRRVHRGTISLGAAATSATATLEFQIDPKNTRIVYLGNSSSEDGNTSMASTGVRVELTDARTVTASRLVGTGTAVVSYELIEYAPGIIRSVQRATVTATGTAAGTATLTIPLQSLGNATIDVLGWDYNVGLAMDQIKGRVVLTDATTVTLTRVTANGNLTAGFQVIEWY